MTCSSWPCRWLWNRSSKGLPATCSTRSRSLSVIRRTRGQRTPGRSPSASIARLPSCGRPAGWSRTMGLPTGPACSAGPSRHRVEMTGILPRHPRVTRIPQVRRQIRPLRHPRQMTHHAGVAGVGAKPPYLPGDDPCPICGHPPVKKTSFGSIACEHQIAAGLAT